MYIDFSENDSKVALLKCYYQYCLVQLKKWYLNTSPFIRQSYNSEKSEMKILVISKIFPNALEPNFGTFVFDETKALSKIHEVRVVAPVPWFPEVKFFKNWYAYSQIPTEPGQTPP